MGLFENEVITMNISLTPELEKIVKEKVQSGLYNNASEVIREALRFMESSEELVYQIKLDKLREKLALHAFNLGPESSAKIHDLD